MKINRGNLLVGVVCFMAIECVVDGTFYITHYWLNKLQEQILNDKMALYKINKNISSSKVESSELEKIRTEYQSDIEAKEKEIELMRKIGFR